MARCVCVCLLCLCLLKIEKERKIGIYFFGFFKPCFVILSKHKHKHKHKHKQTNIDQLRFDGGNITCTSKHLLHQNTNYEEYLKQAKEFLNEYVGQVNKHTMV